MDKRYSNNDHDEPKIVFSGAFEDSNLLNQESNLAFQQSLQVGYFPHETHSPTQGMQVLCESAAMQKLRSSFGVMYSEGVHRRLIDMISQCRYIASKKGMDKRQLIESIRQDETIGRDYIASFQDTPCNGDGCIKKFPEISFATASNNTRASPCVNNGDHELCWETISNQVKADHDGIVMCEPHYHNCCSYEQSQSHSPHFKTESDVVVGEDQHHPCIFVSRPPTRHGIFVQPLPNYGVEGLMDEMELFEDSDESDFDPSQTSDLFEEINFANASPNKKRCMDDQEGRLGVEMGKDNIGSLSYVIPPNRKPGSHNLTARYKHDEEIMEKAEKKLGDPNMTKGSRTVQHELLNSFNSEIPQETDLSSSDDDEAVYDEAKKLIVTTARAKACASYIQFRQKLTEQPTITSTRAPFGTFDECDQHFLKSYFVVSDESIAKDSAQPDGNNRHKP